MHKKDGLWGDSLIELNKIYNEDCLGDKEKGTGMWRIPDKSIDMILCDLPYGTTACKWDTIIPFESLWEQYKRIIKDNGAIVLTASQPFTSLLIMSNLQWFKYCWVWDKVRGTGFQVAKYRPLMQHEDICVFGKGRLNYYPIMEERDKVKKSKCYTKSDSNPLKYNDGKIRVYDKRHPTSILRFSNASQKGKVHPTQKPVELFEYLIRTYTKEGDIVLDNCMGSGTTAVACIRTNRKFVGFEIEQKYVEIANLRIEAEYNKIDDEVFKQRIEEIKRSFNLK